MNLRRWLVSLAIIVPPALLCVLLTLGYTVYRDDPSPWRGWFLPTVVLTFLGCGISVTVTALVSNPYQKYFSRLYW